jgi:hypothetical protein
MQRLTPPVWALTLILTAGLVTLSPQPSDASPLTSGSTVPFRYETTGTLNGPSSGYGPIWFSGVTPTQITAPTTFALGSFFVPALPVGASLSYNDVAFAIVLKVAGPGGSFANADTLTIDGVLNGTIDGSRHSTMVASVVSVTPYVTGTSPIPLDAFHILSPQAIQAPIGAPYGPGSTQFDAYVAGPITPAPEPVWTTALLVAIGGLFVPARAALGRRRA